MKQIPMFLYHGTDDNVLSLEDTELSYAILKEKIYIGDHEKNLEFHSEEGLQHKINTPELTLLNKWLRERFA